MEVFRPYVAVVGAGTATDEQRRTAHEVGRLLAAHGAVVLCGGLGGVMDATAAGVREGGGVVVGLLPGSDRRGASHALTVALATGLGEMRNPLLVRAADAVIAIGGEYGTLSEVAFALRTGKPVIGLQTWDLPDVVVVEEPQAAVELAVELARAAEKSAAPDE